MRKRSMPILFKGRRAGGHLTFESLLRPHLKPLYRVAYRLTRRREDAEDLVQDLLTKLYPRRDELEGIERLRPWLLRVMYRQFLDQRRQNSRSPLHLVSEPQPADATGDPMERLISPDGDPEAGAEQAAQNLVLLGAIARLNEDHQRVLALHDIEGYTLEELQIMLDCPVGTLKSRLHRARARLRVLLAEVEEKEPSSPRLRQVQRA